MPTTVHLVRHAQTAALGVCLAGRADGCPLTEEGEAACARLADGLAHLRFAAIVSSPMLRAQQTAACVAARGAVAVTTDPGFDEIDFGHWTGLGFAALRDDPQWQRWNRQRSLARIPGGETMALAQARALAAMAQLRDGFADAELLVVSHADIIKSVLANVLGAPLDLMHRFAVDPASRSVVRLFDDAAAEILAVNLPPGA